jgi:dihydrofolate reductase
LIDEYQLVINPIILGGGKPLCEGVGAQLNLTLRTSRTFANGNVFSSYAPAS